MHRTKCSVRSLRCGTSLGKIGIVSEPRIHFDPRIQTLNGSNVTNYQLLIVRRFSNVNLKKAFKLETRPPNTEDKLLITTTLNRPTQVASAKDVYAKVTSLKSSYKILDLLNKGQLEDAEAVWHDIKSNVGQPEGLPKITVDIYEQVIKMYGKMGKMEELQNVWQEMQDSGIVPTEKLYTAFILALSAQKMMAEAEDVCDLMAEAKIPFTYFTFHAMIKGYLDCGQPKIASDWHKRMKERNLPENEVTFNIFMNYMKDTGKTHNVFVLLEQMKENGIQPSQRTYAVLLQTLAVEGKLDEMLSTFQEAKDVLTPNRVLFNIVLTALAKSGLVATMQEIFNEMKNVYNLKPTAVDYLAVINGFGKKGHIEYMQKMFDEMLRFGVQPTSAIMTVMMDCAGKHGTTEMVEEYMKLMVDLNIPFEISTYEVLLQIYGRSGDTETMEKIFEAMKSLIPKRNPHSYHIVISHLVTVKDYKKSLGYYERMKEEGLEPWLVSHANAMKAYLELDDKEKLKEILKKYVEDKNQLSEIGQAFLSLYPFAERSLMQRKFDQFVKKILEKKTTEEEK